MADKKPACAMRVFSKTRLRWFWESPGRTDSEAPLREWYKTVSDRDLSWRNFAEVKAMYASASIFQHCVIFNIGGNKYRLIAKINYPHTVFVVQVLTHRDYDKGLWKAACHCAE